MRRRGCSGAPHPSAAAERIRLLITRTRTELVEIGRELIAQKESLGHGNFLPWIEAEFGMSDDTALNLMRVAKSFGDEIKSRSVRNLPATVLYQLAAPSTPEDVREAFVREAEAQGGASPDMIRADRADVLDIDPIPDVLFLPALGVPALATPFVDSVAGDGEKRPLEGRFGVFDLDLDALPLDIGEVV